MKTIVRPRWRLLWLTPSAQLSRDVPTQSNRPPVRAAWRSHAAPAPAPVGRQHRQCHATATAVETLADPASQLVGQHGAMETVSAEDIMQGLRQNCMFDVAPGYEVLKLSLPPPPFSNHHH